VLRQFADQWLSRRIELGESDWKIALAEFWRRCGQRLDVLLNNAGVLASGRFETIPLARHEAMLAVNVRGMITGCHGAFAYLARTPGAQVIDMASATAIYGQPELATYPATKFAVRGFTEALDPGWSPFGVRVSDIWPTFFNTAMADEYGRIPSAKSLGIRLGPAHVPPSSGTARPSARPSTRRTGRSACSPLCWHSRPAWGAAAITRWVVRRLSIAKI
jgi:NAD(P)-dependent dehydrogenase (short-subunit alcohol dehydrogenase family)